MKQRDMKKLTEFDWERFSAAKALKDEYRKTLRETVDGLYAPGDPCPVQRANDEQDARENMLDFIKNCPGLRPDVSKRMTCEDCIYAWADKQF